MCGVQSVVGGDRAERSFHPGLNPPRKSLRLTGQARRVCRSRPSRPPLLCLLLFRSGPGSTPPVRAPGVLIHGARGFQLSTLRTPHAHGGLRGTVPINRITCPQPGQTGGGTGAGGPATGARQSSSARMRSHFGLAAAPSRVEGSLGTHAA